MCVCSTKNSEEFHVLALFYVKFPGRAGGFPPGPPTDPYVRNERIRFLGNQSLGTTLAHHCATLHGQSDVGDDPGCGQARACQQLLELLPVARALTTAPTQPVLPCPLRVPGDDLQQAEVASHPVVPEVPTPLQAEPLIRVFQGGMTVGAPPPPSRLREATEALPGCPPLAHPVPLA